jgi:hypothetical protein
MMTYYSFSILKTNWRNLIALLVFYLCSFFVADSNPRQSINLKNLLNKKKYKISLNKDSIFQNSDF